MKKIYFVFTVLFCFYSTSSVFAQTNVTPNVPDALFNAVSAASAGDVLVLAEGGIYPNSASLPVSVPLTIKTADGAASKAKVVLLANTTDEYPDNIITASASITIKKVIFDGRQGNVKAFASRFIDRSDNFEDGGKIHVDGIEVSRVTAVSMGNDVDSLICINSLFYGNLSGASGWGGTWDFQHDEIQYAKVQNNTIMFCTFGPWLDNGWGNYTPLSRQKQNIIIDHNTMFNIDGAHGPTVMISRAENITFTNNLYVNGTFRANEFFSDKYKDFPQNEDELGENAGQISALGPKGTWLISVEMVDSAGTVMNMSNNNIVWTSDVLAKWAAEGVDKPWIWTNETEAAIVDPENAYFEEEVSFVNAPEVPMFAINKIAEYTAMANAAMANGDTTYYGSTPYQGWDWWDTDGSALFDLRGRDNLNMSYNTDAISYTAGIDGFPLGDLNWFPELKEIWESGGVVAVEKEEGLPNSFELSQNYPNPFNPTTKIAFSLPESGIVSLKVFNILGQEVAELINEEMQAGNYNFDFNASELSSGLYIYKLTAGSFTSSKKMMLMK